MKKYLRVLLVAGLILTMLVTSVSAAVVLELDNEAKICSEPDEWNSIKIDRLLDNPVDATGAEYLYIRFYLESIDTFAGDGQIEITSFHQADTDELNWKLQNQELVAGWNELKLPLNAPDEAMGTFNPGAVLYYRIYAIINGANSIAVDYVVLGGPNEDLSNLSAAAAPVETEVPAAVESEGPEVSAPAENVAAPATADAGILAAVSLLAISAATVLKMKKR